MWVSSLEEAVNKLKRFVGKLSVACCYMIRRSEITEVLVIILGVVLSLFYPWNPRSNNVELSFSKVVHM